MMFLMKGLNLCGCLSVFIQPCRYRNIANNEMVGNKATAFGPDGSVKIRS